MHSPSRIQFGHFEFDLESGELWKRGRKAKLAPQPARLLALLANSSGCLVTRESIQRQLWGEGTFIDFEHGLNFCIRKIRAVLGDSAKRPKYIETLPRRGYRFIAATTTIGSGPHSNGDVNRSDAGAVNRFVTPSSETARIEAYEHYAAARIRFAQVGKESLEAARQGFERAIALQPDYALAHSGLGASYALRTVSRRDPDDLERAQSHLLQALELDPELAEPYPWLCYVYMRRGQLSPALEAGKRGVKLQPELVHAHYFLGLAYFAQCETDPSCYQEAADSLLQAARVGPGWQPTWFVLSYLALLNGDYKHAGQFAQHLARIASETRGLPFVGAEIVLASVKMRQRQGQAARTLLLGFLERMNASDHMYRDGMTAVAACLLGDVEMREANTAEALLAYRRAWHAVQEHPRIMAHQRISARVQAGLASAYAAGKEHARAAGLLTRAVDLATRSEAPEHSAAGATLVELHWGLAAACMRTNQRESALQFLSKAIRAGWRDAAWLQADPEFAPLRGEPQFLEAITRIAAAPRVRFSDVLSRTAASPG